MLSLSKNSHQITHKKFSPTPLRNRIQQQNKSLKKNDYQVPIGYLTSRSNETSFLSISKKISTNKNIVKNNAKSIQNKVTFHEQKSPSLHFKSSATKTPQLNQNKQITIKFNTEKVIAEVSSPRFYKKKTSGTMKDIGNQASVKETTNYSTMKDIKNVSQHEKPKKLSFLSKKGHQKEKSCGVLPWRRKKISGEDFKIIKLLGKGKYGRVFLVQEILTGFLMALKVIQKKVIVEGNLLEQFIRQIKIQFYLCHPNIIKLYGFFDDSENFYLLMELGCGGELYQYTLSDKKFNQEQASFISFNLLKIFKYIHSEKVIHRDLKPENIVIILGTVKLCDFGWSVYNNNEMRTTFCGTPLYFSPQLLSDDKYDEKVDLWAIGIITYELIFGKSPFNLEKPTDILKIVTSQIDYPENSSVSRNFKKFLQKILQKDPNKRLSATQLLEDIYIKQYESNQICETLCFPPLHPPSPVKQS